MKNRLLHLLAREHNRNDVFNKIESGFLHSLRSVEMTRGDSHLAMTHRALKLAMTIATILAVFAVVSCEVGLGEAVDVNPPAVDITYPPASSVVRDEFILAGTCKDDTGVEKIVIKIYDTKKSNQIVPYELNPVIEGKNKWHVAINRQKADGSYPLSDGNYTFEVYAMDDSNRVSANPSTRTLEIDNTAPVFIISSPAVTEVENATEYGSSFKINGKIAEDHTISSLLLKIFDENKNKIGDGINWDFQDVDASGGTSLTAAQFFRNVTASLASDKKALHDHYVDIYGTTDGITKKFTCTIEIEDSARSWTSPDYSDKATIQGNKTSGNKTTKLWLNDDVYTDLMSSTSEHRYEVGDIKKIWCGQKTDDAARTLLESKVIDTEQKYLAFSLNNNASPTYLVAGYDVGNFGSLNFGNKKAAKNATINFQASAGLDGNLLKPETFNLYMFGPIDDSGDKIGGVLVDDIYSNADSNFAALNLQGKAEQILKNGLAKDETTGDFLKDASGEYEKYKKGSVTNYSVAITLSDGIAKGKKYLFVASGKDQENIDLETSANKYYGFVGETAGTPPVLHITAPENNDVFQDNTNLVISGDATSTESSIQSVSYEIVVMDDIQGTKVGKITGSGQVDASNKFSLRVANGNFVGENGYTSGNPATGNMYSYSLSIKATDNAGLEVRYPSTINIALDNFKPRVNFITESIWFTSSEPKIEVVATDKDNATNKCSSGIEKVEYAVDANITSATSHEMIPGFICYEDGSTRQNPPAQKIWTLYSNDLSDFSASGLSEGSHTIKARATDNVGNVSDEKSLTIKIDTIKPSIQPLVYKNAPSTSELNNYTIEVPIIESGSGVASIKVYQGNTQLDNTKYSIKDAATNTAISFNQASPVITAANTPKRFLFTFDNSVWASGSGGSFRFLATDVAGNSNDATATVSIDNTPPEVSNVTWSPRVDDNGTEKANGDITVTVTASDDIKLASVKMAAVGQIAESTRTISSQSGTATWTVDTTKLTNNQNNTINFTATDEKGNISAIKPLVIFVDQETDRPKIDISDSVDETVTSESAIQEGKNLFDKNGKITGTISDDDGISSVKVMYKSVVSSTAQPPATAWKELKLSNTNYADKKSWTLSASLIDKATNASLSEGAYLLKIEVEDNVKKSDGEKFSTGKKTIERIAFALDLSAPTVAFDDNTRNKVNKFYGENDAITITGEITEGSGVAVLKRKLMSNGTETEVHRFGGSGVSSPLNGDTWTDTITVGSASASYEYVATDKYGRESVPLTFNYRVDDANPTISITSPHLVPPATKIYLPFTRTQTQRFEGSAADTSGSQNGNSGLEKVQWTFDGASATDDKWNLVTGSENWNTTVDFTGKNEGDNVVTFRAVDKAGKKATDTRTVVIDKTLPVISDVVVKIDSSTTGGMTGKTAVSAQDGVYYLKAASYTIEGKVADAYFKSLKINGAAVIDSSTTVGMTGLVSITGNARAFSHTITGATSGDVVILAEDEAGQTSEKKLNVIVDTTLPDVTMNLEKIISDSSVNNKTNNVNGMITVTGNASDNDRIARSRVDILNASGQVVSITGVSGVSGVSSSLNDQATSGDLMGRDAQNVSWTFDTTKLTDESAYTVKISTYDRAGNVSEATKAIYVCQATDKPTVNAQNASGTITYSTIADGQNLFDLTSNNTVKFDIKDDDALQSVTITCYEMTDATTQGSEVNADRKTITVPSAKTLAMTANYVVPSTEGKYKLVVDVTDSGGNHNSEAVYFIGVDAGSPSLKVTTSESFKAANKDLTIQGEVKDSSGTVRLYEYSTVEAAQNHQASHTATATAFAVLTGTSTDVGWSIVEQVETEGRTIYFLAEDAYKRCSIVDWTYKVDAASPTVASGWSVPSNASVENSEWTKDSAFTYQIPLSDSWDGTKKLVSPTNVALYSDIKVVNVINENNGLIGTMTKGDEYKVGGETFAEGCYIIYNYTTALTEGTHTVTIDVEDVAGNKATAIATYKHKLDKTLPVLTLGSYDDKLIGSDIAALSSTNKYTIPVAFSDALSGINVATIKVYDGTNELTSGVEVVDSTGQAVSSTLNAQSLNALVKFDTALLTTGSHSFVIEVCDVAGNKNSVTAPVSIDQTAPTLVVSGVSPTVTENGTEYVNGKIKVSGTVVDETKLATTDAVVLKVLQGNASGSEVSGKEQKITFPENSLFKQWEFEIDTTGLTDNQSYALKIIVQDAVGNTAENALTIINVKQETDKPKIDILNMTSTVKTENGINADTNLFASKAASLMWSITDDDEIKDIKVEYAKAKIPTSGNASSELVADGTWVTLKHLQNVGKAVYSAPVTIQVGESDTAKLAEGTYLLKVTVTDVNDTGAAGANVWTRNEMEPFAFALDNSAPIIKVDTENGKFWNATFTVTGTIKEGNLDTATAIERVDENGQSFSPKIYATLTAVSGKTDEYTWSDSVTVDATSTGGTFIYKATDKYSRSTESDPFVYKVDNIAPTLSINNPNNYFNDGEGTYLGFANTNSYLIQFTGTATDSGTITSKSGVSKVEYVVTTTEELSGSETWHDDVTYNSANGEWKANVDFAGVVTNEGEAYLHVRALDGANNVFTANPKTFYIDLFEPVIDTESLTLYKSDDATVVANKADDGNYYIRSSNYSLKIKASDTNISSVTFGDSRRNTYDLSPDDDAVWFVLETPIVESDIGSVKNLEITASDWAGQTSKISFNLLVDSVKPTIDVSIIPALITSSLSGTERTNCVNGDITIKVSATDNDRIKLVEAPTFKQGNVPLTPSITGGISQGGWKFNTTQVNTGLPYSITLTATDRAGNIETTTTEIFVDQNTDKPIIASQNATTDINYNTISVGNNLFNTSTNRNISLNLSDDDGLKTVTINCYKDNNTTATDTKTPTLDETPKNASLSYMLPSEEGKYKVEVTARDTEYKSTGTKTQRGYRETTVTYYVAVDAGIPAIKVTTPQNLFVGTATATTINGTVEDSSDTVTIYKYLTLDAANKKLQGDSDATDGEGTPKVISGASTQQNWTDSVQATSGESGTKSIYYVAKDAYGQMAMDEFKYNVDSVSPSFNSGNINLVGKNNSDSASISLGSYDSTNVYFATNSIQISSKTWRDANDEAITEDNMDKIKVTSQGVTEIAEANALQVTTGAHNAFSTNVSLNDGQSTVTLKALDKGGNFGTQSITFNVDATSPTLTSVAFVNANDANYNIADRDATKAVPISVVATDATSGVKKIIVKKGNQSVATKELDVASSTLSDQVRIPSTAIAAGENVFSVLVVDLAGNESLSQTVTVTADFDVPTVEITSHKNGNTVNKTIHLEGRASDRSGEVASGKLEVATVSGTGSSATVGNYSQKAIYTKGGASNTITLSDGVWECDLDTTDFTTSATPTATISVRVNFTDSQGNASSETATGAKNIITLNVDQNTDRPEIKLSNIKISGSSTTQDTIRGTVQDDDGDIKGMWYWNAGVSSTAQRPSNVPTLSNDNGWTKIAVEAGTGSWTQVLPSDATANQNWYFYVIDEKDGAFGTTGSDALQMVYLSDVETTKAAGAVSGASARNGISFVFDKNAPSPTVFVKTGSTTSPDYASALGESLTSEWQPISTFGPTANVWVKVVVTEKEGMAASDPVVVIYDDNAVSQSGEVSHTAGTDKYIYLFGPILSSTLKSGTSQISATATDNAGRMGSDMKQITRDAEPPEVSVLAPSNKISDKIISKTSIRGLVVDSYSRITELLWAIPKKGETKDNVSNWKQIGDGNIGSSWAIDFSSSASDDPENSIIYYVSANNRSQYDVVDSMTISSSDDFSGGEVGVYKVPIWFKATDSAGNTKVYDENYVWVDEDAGKPTAKIISPETNAKMNGKFTIYGSAVDLDGSVVRVNLSIKIGNDAATEVEAVGTTSWKYDFDTGSIANGTAVEIKAKATDDETKTRGWTSTISFIVDNTIPQVKNVRLEQYGPGGWTSGAVPIVQRPYEAGMFISNNKKTTNGDWYLVADVSAGTDGTNISSIKYSKAGLINSHWQDTDDTPGSASYTIRKQITTDLTSGDVYYNIEIANDAATPVKTYTAVNINIDSVAPTVEKKSDGADAEIKLKTNVNDEMIGQTAGERAVFNNQGYFTFGDNVVEDGSGLDFVTFYFTRDKNASSKVYCPMVSSTASNSTAVGSSASNGQVFVNEDGITSLYCNSGISNTDNTITVSGIATNVNIRKMGLIRILGSYRKIKDITGNTVTFEPSLVKNSDGSTPQIASAEFIYAQVVDYIGTETRGRNDDGDEMIESIIKVGGTYTWDATIDSTNIPDGPITIHVTAFDKAGNVAGGSVLTRVENSPPRIAKVLLGTDLNGNEKFDFKAHGKIETSIDDEKKTKNGRAFCEFSYYSALNSNGGYDAVTTLDTRTDGDNDTKFKVKNDFCIIPEFVGGNNSLKYVYADGEKTTAQTGNVTDLMPTTALASKVTSNAGTGETGVFDTTIKDTIPQAIKEFGGIVLPNTHAAFTNDGEKTLSFTFWDETEDMTQGQDSQWTVLNIPVNVQTNDTIPPTPTITPFYWNDENDNSVYRGQDGKLQGHIELERDLNFQGNPFTDDDGEFDKDPKLSGKVILKGVVFDNTRVTQIAICSTSLIGGDEDNPIVLAKYEANGWSPTGNKGNNNAIVSFDIEEIDISQNGHTSEWTLVLDTEKVLVTLDDEIQILATDWKNNNSVNVSTDTNVAQTTTASPTYYYKVDVVPYITDIKTGRSSFSSNHSVFSRTARGHYPVRLDEEFIFDGFNLGDGIEVLRGGVNNEGQIPTTGGRTAQISAADNVGSGDVCVRVDQSVISLNSLNNNDAPYNKVKNGINNDNLNDDTYIDVWEFKTAAKPVNGAAQRVTMKIDPTTTQPGFSFANSILYFNMPGRDNGRTDENTYGNGTNGTKYSQLPFGMNYGGFSHNTFTYDKFGNSYGVAMCTDTQSAKASAFFQFFSRQAPLTASSMDQNMNYHNSFNASRLDSSTVQVGENWVTDIDRIQSPSMATTTVATAGASQTVTVYKYKQFSYTNLGYILMSYNGRSGDDRKVNGDKTINGAGTYEFSTSDEPTKISDEPTNAIVVRIRTGAVINSKSVDGFYCWNGDNKPNGDFNSASISSWTAQTETYPTLNGDVYVYLAYYDKSMKEIRFRWGTVGSNANDIDKATAHGLSDICGTQYNGNKMYSKGDGNHRQESLPDSQTKYGSTAVQTVNGDGHLAGQYVSLSILGKDTATPTAIVTWYDARNRQLLMAHKQNPTSSAGGWSYEVIDDKGGMNVVTAVDGAGGIHFAYYDAINGSDLKYAYLSNIDATPQIVKIDTYGAVGAKCTIDVAKVGNNWVPYIGYQSNAYLGTPIASKIAYRADWSTPAEVPAGVGSGADAEKYTGAWEVSIVPTNSIPNDDLINVGLAKEADGTMKNFIDNGNEGNTQVGTGTFIHNNTLDVCPPTNVYGNGTSNPIVGYGIDTGAIEYGQMR